MTEKRNAAEHIPLTAPEFHVLATLAEGPKHGYLIMKDVAERTEGQVELSTGTLYGIVKRLARNGWIAETRHEINVGGRRRRSYRLTGFGREVAKAEAERLRRVVLLARDYRLLGPETA